MWTTMKSLCVWTEGVFRQRQDPQRKGFFSDDGVLDEVNIIKRLCDQNRQRGKPEPNWHTTVPRELRADYDSQV